MPSSAGACSASLRQSPDLPSICPRVSFIHAFNASTEMAKAFGEGRGGGERWHVRKDGSQFWATGTLMLLRNGSVEGFLNLQHWV